MIKLTLITFFKTYLDEDKRNKKDMQNTNNCESLKTLQYELDSKMIKFSNIQNWTIYKCKV